MLGIYHVCSHIVVSIATDSVLSSGTAKDFNNCTLSGRWSRLWLLRAQLGLWEWFDSAAAAELRSLLGCHLLLRDAILRGAVAIADECITCGKLTPSCICTFGRGSERVIVRLGWEHLDAWFLHARGSFCVSTRMVVRRGSDVRNVVRASVFMLNTCCRRSPVILVVANLRLGKGALAVFWRSLCRWRRLFL